MTIPLFSRVILNQDIHDQERVAGDMGTIAEHHPARGEHLEGYKVECFADNRETIAVASVPANGLRPATSQDALHVRQLSPSST